VRDRTDLQRIGDDHFSDMRSQRVHDRSRVAGCFQHDLIVSAQPFAKLGELVNRQTNFAARAASTILKINNFPKCAMHIKTYNSHDCGLL
jgi:hypothetical protein